MHTLNCMFRIWKCNNFYWAYERDPEAVQQFLPPTIQNELHAIARESIKSAQRTVMTELNRVAQKPLPTSIPLWACLWLTIFIYHDLWKDHLPAMVNHQLVNKEAIPRAERLFRTLMVSLGCNFRNSSPAITIQYDPERLRKQYGCDEKGHPLENTEYVLSCLQRAAEEQNAFRKSIVIVCS